MNCGTILQVKFSPAIDFERSCLPNYITQVPKNNIAVEKAGPDSGNEDLLVIVCSDSIFIRFSKTSGFQKLKSLGNKKSVVIYFSFAQVGTAPSTRHGSQQDTSKNFPTASGCFPNLRT